MAEPLIQLPEEPRVRRPALGYAMVWTAALLFAVNGTVAKVVLESAGLSTVELTQARSTGAFLGFALVLAVTRPRSFRVGRRELLSLSVFGVTGVAFVQWLYFVAIDRLPIGIALLLQYLAPLLVALWARYVLREPVRRRIWAALALALAGLSLIVQVWAGGLALDGVGVAAALGAAGAYALYVLMAERAVARRDPISVACYGFLFAAAFWFAVQPLWEFPLGRLGAETSLLGNLAGTSLPAWLLVAFVVVGGTIASFGLIVTALRHVPATRVAIVAMLEPVAATAVAWVWLGETLGPEQLAGGAIVLAAIVLAQTSR
ncbi:MAG: EamA family transporter [Thermoleophilia bacterium]|nr:EamA family transporter [Thermoleophilia bacterium]